MKGILGKIFEIHPSIDRHQRKPIKALIVAMIFAITWCTIFIVLFSLLKSWMAILGLGYALIGLLILRELKQRGNGALFIALFNVQLISFLLIAIYNFGWEVGFQYPLITPFLFAFLPRYKTMWFPVIISLVDFLAIMAGYYIIQHLHEGRPEYSESILNVMFVTNIAVTCVGVAIMSKLYQRDTLLSEQKIDAERLQSDRLLHNILPASIATRLKNDDQIIADGFESVSVLFADIVGFTKLSETIPPKELVSHLNRVFTKFDELVDKYQLEKIKTIGDAYMVSGGLEHRSIDHLEKIAMMAFDMLKSVDELSHSTSDPIKIRIGIHTGPVVAGVIGLKKFAYDLWGDTVNIASRMESQGMEGRIHVTEEVKNSLDHKFSFERREPVEIKGKRLMQTYFLGRR